MHEILNTSFLNNTLLMYAAFLLSWVLGVCTVFLFKKYILGIFRKWVLLTKTAIDDKLLKAVELSLIPMSYFGAFYFSINLLELPAEVHRGLQTISVVVITLLFVRAITFVMTDALESYVNQFEYSSGSVKQLKGIIGLFNFIIWIIALIILLDNLGVKVSAVIAGLGVGGIAVALASKAVLCDIFNYFVIFFDKPFQIGDLIDVGEKRGHVEYIGIKTTRIRAISGEQIVLANSQLTSSSVQNFKSLEQRRAAFKLRVAYGTTLENLKYIPTLVQEIIEINEHVIFDRGHFSEYGDWSLNFEFVYFVRQANYKSFMDIQQAINLAIFERFREYKISLAYIAEPRPHYSQTSMACSEN